jgi:peptidoglycan/xylan/chitin deacetylase (PgdA/CDA1 family)
MLFKRYLFLAACLLLYIFGFIAYFTVARAQMETRFRDAREKYHVEGLILTTNAPPVAPSAPVTTPIASAPMVPAPAPTETPSSTPDASAATNAAPADNSAPVDTNLIIGPVPPPPSTDGSTNAPAPATPPDSGSTPMTPSSTSNESHKDIISNFLVRAAYQPSLGAIKVQAPGSESTRPTLTVPMPVSAPATNAPNGSTNTSSTVTNAPTAAPTGATNTAVAPATNAELTPVAPLATNTGRAAGVEASVIVLLYHQFTASNVHAPPKMQWTMNVDVFASEMKYIHDNGYHVIPMSDLIKFLHHEIGLPPNSVVITIDDGYKSAVVYAAPILKQYGYPWTFFIYPDFVTVAEGKGAVSWNDLLALQADGVDIESHSMTHPQLPKHTQKWKGSIHALSPEEYDEWLTNETLGSKTELEQKMGKPILCFAYPYGAYNKEVEAKSIAAGYQYIFTVADNPVRSSTDPHSIGRYTITQGVEKNFAAYLRQGALGLADADPAPGTTTSNPRPVITAVLGYAGTLDPNSIETEVRDYGVVKHDFDPKTSTIRLYLPRDLIQPVNLVNIRVKDAQSGQVMVANWHFNYVPAGAVAPTHPPIATTTNAAPAAATPTPSSSETPMSAGTNAASNVSTPEPATKGAAPSQSTKH